MAGAGTSRMNNDINSTLINGVAGEDEVDVTSEEKFEKCGVSIPYDSYAESLERTLTDASLPTPLTVGIFSHWGGGKSYLIKKLLYKMKDGACSQYCSKLKVPPEPKHVHWQTTVFGGKFKVSFFNFLISLIVSSVLACLGVSAYMAYTFVMFDDHEQTTIQPSNNLTTIQTETTADQIVSNLHNHISIPIISAAVFLGILSILAVITMCAICCRDETKRSFADKIRHFRLLIIMLICKSPPSPLRGDSKVEIIPVYFNAWQYTGSDNLWAAVITNLMDQTETLFGLWKTRLYRLCTGSLVHEHDVCALSEQNWWKKSNENLDGRIQPTDPEKSQNTAPQKKSEERKDVVLVTENMLKIPKPIFICLVGSGCTIALVILLILIIEYNVGYNTDLDKFYVIIIQSVAGGFLGLTLVSQIRNIYAIGSSLYQKQSARITGFIQQYKAKGSREDMSAKLGFMRKVKDEVELLFGFIRSMERLYQKPFRICLFVEDISHLPKSQVKRILDAFSLLLSDHDAPIISVLSIDPLPVLSALDQMSKETSVSSIELLNRIINMKLSLPVPTKSDVDKMLAFQANYTDLTEVTRERKYRQIIRKDEDEKDHLSSTLQLARKTFPRLSQGNSEREAETSFGAVPNKPGIVRDSVKQLRGTQSAIQDSSTISRSNPDFKLYEFYLTATNINPREADNISSAFLSDNNITPESLRCAMVDISVRTLLDHTELLPGSYRKINRLLNTIHLSVDIWLSQLEKHEFTPDLKFLRVKLLTTCKELGWWLILCELWPYRTSWIIQRVYDANQNTEEKDLKSLWSDVLPSYNKHTGVKSLSAWSNLEHEGQSFDKAVDLFSQLKGLTIRRFLPLTVNIDRSIVEAVNQHIIECQ